MYFRIAIAAAVAGVCLMAQPIASVAQDKKATCNFGADDQKLKGAERKKFMSRCMAKGDAPAKKTVKKTTKKKKTTETKS